ADAGHMLTDVFALGLAWFAASQALRPADERRTYGYQRIGILAALFNAAALLGIAVFIAFEAYMRFQTTETVNGTLMLGVAALALLVNVTVAWHLSRSGPINLNLRGALIHVLGDVAASAAVIVAAAAIAISGIYQLDAIAGLVVAVLICFGAWQVIGEALRILMEATPSDINVAEMVRQILHVPGIQDVHDLHVWSLSSEMRVLSCHVLVEDQRTSDTAATLGRIKQLLRERFGVTHSTIEVECQGCEIDNAFCSQFDEHQPQPAETLGS